MERVTDGCHQSHRGPWSRGLSPGRAKPPSLWSGVRPRRLCIIALLCLLPARRPRHRGLLMEAPAARPSEQLWCGFRGAEDIHSCPHHVTRARAPERMPRVPFGPSAVCVCVCSHCVCVPVRVCPLCACVPVCVCPLCACVPVRVCPLCVCARRGGAGGWVGPLCPGVGAASGDAGASVCSSPAFPPL